MTKFDEISFTYKPRLGPVAAITFAVVLAAATFAIANYGLSINRNMSLYGIKFGPNAVKIFFLIFSALLAYLAIKTVVVTARSYGAPRVILVSTESISAPISPSSKITTSIQFSKIKDLKLNAGGNSTVLEIHHDNGKLEIPKTMIESDESFENLTQLILERARTHHA